MECGDGSLHGVDAYGAAAKSGFGKLRAFGESAAYAIAGGLAPPEEPSRLRKSCARRDANHAVAVRRAKRARPVHSEEDRRGREPAELLRRKVRHEPERLHCWLDTLH